jgi:DNA-binding ferritin-like protein
VEADLLALAERLRQRGKHCWAKPEQHIEYEAAAALREARAIQDANDALLREVERLRRLLREVRLNTHVADLGLDLADRIDAELGDRHE